jgi:hypothetical protein
MSQTMSWLDIRFHHNTQKPTEIYIPNYHTTLSCELAANKTAKNIHRQFPKPLILCCSGGVDSQAMLHAWHNANIDKSDIKVVSFVYNDNSNDFDLGEVHTLCNTLGFNHEYIPFDLKIFLDSGEYLSYQTKYWTTSPQMAAHMKMTEYFNHGTVIMSGTAGSYLNLRLGNTTILSEYYYANIVNNISEFKKFIPFFFAHDQHIGTAFYDAYSDNPLPKDSNILNDSLVDYKHKVKIYQISGFPVVPQDIDFSGFEGFKIFYDDVKLTFKEKLLWGQTENPSRRPFDTLFRYKSQQHIKYNDLVVYHQK